MKLWLLSQNDRTGYGVYDSMVVTANTEDQARLILPRENRNWEDNNYYWASKPELVTVQLIGTAVRGTKQGVVITSFNAG